MAALRRLVPAAQPFDKNLSYIDLHMLKTIFLIKRKSFLIISFVVLIFLVFIIYIAFSYRRVLPIVLNTSTGSPYYVEVKELSHCHIFKDDIIRTLERHNVNYFRFMGKLYFEGDESDLANYTEHVLSGHIGYELSESKRKLYEKYLKKYQMPTPK